MDGAIPVAAPWYRHRWPWLLMAGPAAVVVAGAVTAWLAISTSDGLVADDYYKRGLLVNQSLERSDWAARAGLAARVELEAGRVSVRLAGLQDPPASLRLAFVHPTRGGSDVQVTVEHRGDGLYSANMPAIASGRWRIALEAERWRVTGDVAVGENTGSFVLDARASQARTLSMATSTREPE